MPKQHTVAEHDCIDSIAHLNGVLPQTLWEHPDNAELRELRGDPNVLLTGDVVAIPDIEEVWHKAKTGARHRFRTSAPSSRVSLSLMALDEVRGGVEYLLEVDGVTTKGTTDDQGRLEFDIKPGAKSASLVISDGERYELLLGGLDPVSEVSGQRQRLVNLGYLHHEGDDVEEFDVAILTFKADHCGLELDPAEIILLEDQEYQKHVDFDTVAQAKLVEVHGS